MGKIGKVIGNGFEGEIHEDEVMRRLYATDASAYREVPLAVILPKNKEDLKAVIKYAIRQNIPLIPRAAGTSLAGQVVGSGIVVDISRYFTKIMELNQIESWVRVEPGVVRDELNFFLKPHGLFFGPETSTANRAMIGGMVGNNSCGSNSIIYGSTRDHLLEVEAILSDGSEVTFGNLTKDEFRKKCEGVTCTSPLEQSIYQQIDLMLSNKFNQQLIRSTFPKYSIPRRNTGYALDKLLETSVFSDSQIGFNFAKLLAGSEGTLAFITAVKLNVDPQPPKFKGLLCIHCHSIDESLRVNLVALKYAPSACELMDHYVLECTKKNIEQRQNRFFVQGDPQAILVVEFSEQSQAELLQKAQSLQRELERNKMGHHYPWITGDDTDKVWTLRKAGLGLLANIPGDAKAVPVIEDTAVDVKDLPAYIQEFNEILKKHNLFSVHYAHAGSGELHLRPILNLKTAEGNALFRKIAEEIALLVKRYRGSLSGEHGDGRLRGEFIEQMIGPDTYRMLKEVKFKWDPQNIFNPGKIVNTPPMNEMLRYLPGQLTPDIKTTLRFDSTQGLVRAAELCNGSGDCRKTELTGGTMCPSYMATKNEKDTTRARANIVRETITYMHENEAFRHDEIKEVMDLCLSCKGCKSECPSNVDIAKIKAETTHQYYQSHGVPFRVKMIGNFNRSYAMGALIPGVFNFFSGNKHFSWLIKSTLGFAHKRSLPLLCKTTLRKWYKINKGKNFGINSNGIATRGNVILFCDEFTNYIDTEIGIQAIKLLTSLGYTVSIPPHYESGRTYLSKGLLTKAKKLANKNVKLLSDLVDKDSIMIGLEPSAILTFRDEYLDLVDEKWLDAAHNLSQHTMTIDEFFASEMDKGKIRKEDFSQEPLTIKLHGHCHQKALSSMVPTKKMLSWPKNYTTQLIPSGCCGMAGSFGYEREHFDLSMKIGGLVLFPAIEKMAKNEIIAAAGTSCRHQIKDGTGKIALHPVEILWKARQKKM